MNDYDHIREIERELSQLGTKRDFYRKRKEQLEPFANLKLAVASGHNKNNIYYYIREKCSKRRRYIGSESDPMVHRVKEYHFVSTALDIIENNIVVLEKSGKLLRAYDPKSINEALPEMYRNAAVDTLAGMPADAAEWIREKEREKASFGEWYPEGLKNRVSDGRYVRTKGEAALLELAISNGIPCVYELPHILNNGAIVHTDLTCLSLVDCRTEILIEHEGSMDDEKYRQKHAWRVENYYLSGYVPNVNIFFTYESLDGSIDLQSIQRIFDGWLKPH